MYVTHFMSLEMSPLCGASMIADDAPVSQTQNVNNVSCRACWKVMP